MAIRRLTLEEWFLKYQLQRIQRRHVHIPVSLEADITELERAYARKGERVPYTALLIKAAALLARQKSFANRVMFSTFYGDRLVEPESVIVNVPVLIDNGGRPHLSAMALPRADTLSLAEIREQLGAGRRRSLDSLPIGRIVARRPNRVWNRWLLRLIHFVAYNFPSIYLKRGGGGITVSSLMNFHERGVEIQPQAFGITAFTLCACSVAERPDGRVVLKVGVAFDHLAVTGAEALEAVHALAALFNGKNPALLQSVE